MKSTANIKKTFFLTFLFSILSFSKAFAGYGMEIKDAHLTFYVEMDNNGIAKLIGLPLEGEYFYDTRKAMLIFKQKNHDQAYTLNVTPLERSLPKARFSRNPGRDKMLIGFDTQSWGLSSQYIDCKEVFTSRKVGEKMKFNMTDIARINIALAHMTGQLLTDKPCNIHVVSKAVGNLMGMPLHAYSLIDRSDFEVKTIRDDKSIEEHKLPEKITMLTDDAYADYLTSLLAGPAYQSYLQTVGRLGDSGITKVKALKRLLGEPENRRKIMPIIPDSPAVEPQLESQTTP
jgi:hypothetical protein